MKKKKELKIFFIKLISVFFVIVFIINMTINLLLDRIPFIADLSIMNKKQIRTVIRNKIREEVNSALNKENLFYDEDKKIIYKLYLKLKNEFESVNNQN